VSDQEDLGRDQEVARALGDIPVPEYGPGFWDRLDARLERESAPAPAEAASVFASVPPIAELQPELEPAPAPAPVELTTVVPMAARVRRERRRSLGLLAAAAAVVVAVLAVRIGADDGDPVQTASEVDGGTRRQGPPDGTTTPADDPQQDGSDVDEPDVDGGSAGRTDSQTTGEGGVADSPDQTELELFTSTSAPRHAPATTSEAAASLAAPATAEAAFVAWATAIRDGDADGALALTGPRTIRYYDELGTSAEEALIEDADPDSWGAWADPKGRHLQPVELGTVDGERAVGLVLDRPADDPADADGRIYVGVPVVRGKSGWKVEPAAFDPSSEGRIEVISPEPGERGLQDLPKGGVIKIAAADEGRYWLGLDFATQVSIPASEAVDGVITWNPGPQRSAALHVLVVAHIKPGQITMLAQTFETAPA
jgi:hypothetical protein